VIGLYSKYNTLAAVLAAQQLGIDEDTIRDTVPTFEGSFFGRRGELTVSSHKCGFCYRKNPVRINHPRRTSRVGGQTTLLVLNDRTPDGTDGFGMWTRKGLVGRAEQWL